jgi:hypothetical protein
MIFAQLAYSTAKYYSTVCKFEETNANTNAAYLSTDRDLIPC